jgi:hypothetical protein
MEGAARGHVLALLMAVSFGAACTGGSSFLRSSRRAPATVPASRPTVAWSRLRNPLLGDAAHALKDPALVATPEGWVLLFSQVTRFGTWRIGIARSADLAGWSDVTTIPHDPSVDGEASPDVQRAPDGEYVVTYQSFPHDRDGAEAKLYARTTTDFRTFSPPVRLAPSVHEAPADRLIDGALVWSPAGLLLGYKVGLPGPSQHFELARSASGALAGPWQAVGRPRITVYGDTVENYQFLTIDGTHRLIATSNQFDRPELFQLAGDPANPTGWLDWSAPRQLQVPQEPWNRGQGVTGVTYEHANAAFLVDGRDIDGHLYLVYSDAPDLATFGGQGHAVIAVARSTDLVHWSVPPG